MATTYYYTVNGNLLGEATGGVETTYIPDALGSTTQTVTSAGVQNQYVYSPYGRLIAKSGTAADPKFLWNGRTQSRTTGCAYAEQYNRRRHFSSTTAQWTTVDPLWPYDAAYTYTSCDPVTKVDRTGLQESNSTPWNAQDHRWGTGRACFRCPNWYDLTHDSIKQIVGSLSGATLAKVNRCINATASRCLNSCDAISNDTARCIGNSTTSIECASCSNPKLCGNTICIGNWCTITLCFPNIQSLDGCINHGLPGGTIERGVWWVMFHEMLHSCGYGHGNTDQGPCSCNNIAACCVLSAVEGKPNLCDPIKWNGR